MTVTELKRALAVWRDAHEITRLPYNAEAEDEDIRVVKPSQGGRRA
jgi:hypothetical protein